jgi:arylformamidase
MIVNLDLNNRTYKADLREPHDISLPLKQGSENPNCYWAEPVRMETIRSGNFVGNVNEGGSVNYQKLIITPHGNGTHTECYGHISRDGATINACLNRFHFVAELISVTPEALNGDLVITQPSVAARVKNKSAQALIIRTLPNNESKKKKQYSGTNPPYLHHATAQYLTGLGIHHLLIDLPSVDRESDDGKLLAHRAFWQFPDATRKASTITELIYVDQKIEDGLYLLNLQIASLEMDASPSKPVLYKLTEVS